MHKLKRAHSALMPGPRESGLYCVMQGVLSIKMMRGGRGKYVSKVERDQTCFSLFLSAMKHLHERVHPSVHQSVRRPIRWSITSFDSSSYTGASVHLMLCI